MAIEMMTAAVVFGVLGVVALMGAICTIWSICNGDML